MRASWQVLPRWRPGRCSSSAAATSPTVPARPTLSASSSPAARSAASCSADVEHAGLANAPDVTVTYDDGSTASFNGRENPEDPDGEQVDAAAFAAEVERLLTGDGCGPGGGPPRVESARVVESDIGDVDPRRGAAPQRRAVASARVRIVIGGSDGSRGAAPEMARSDTSTSAARARSAPTVASDAGMCENGS